MSTQRGWLDPYERRARLLPALLACLPLLVLAAALGLRESLVVSAATAVIVGVGTPVIVAGMVRDRGKQLERRLWRRWGGPPTSLLLRHNGDDVSPLREARRQRLEALTGERLPTADEQLLDPDAAEQRYGVAVAEARRVTRDRTSHPIVYAENVDYGTARNTLAIRPYGILAAGLGIAGAAIAAVTAFLERVAYGPPELIVSVSISVTALVFWMRYPTEQRVRRAGERYAEHLLDAIPDPGAQSSQQR